MSQDQSKEDLFRGTEFPPEIVIALVELFTDNNKKIKNVHEPDERPIPSDSLENTVKIDEAITFNDIAGQPQAVEAARRLAMQIKNPGYFKQFGVELTKGVLFTGPPGTGKTLLAKALANECGVPFRAIRSSEIVSKWLGESTINMAKVFDELRKEMHLTGSANAVLYIDEVDAISQRRDPGGGEVGQENTRIISELLQQIDGYDTKPGIVLIASTNRPESLDGAFLSRMSAKVEVPLPNREGLISIMKLLFSKATLKAGRKLIPDNFNFDLIVPRMSGFSGRDINNVVKATLLEKAIKRDFSQITAEDIFIGIQNTGIGNTRGEIRRRIGFLQ